MKFNLVEILATLMILAAMICSVLYFIESFPDERVDMVLSLLFLQIQFYALLRIVRYSKKRQNKETKGSDVFSDE